MREPWTPSSQKGWYGMLWLWVLGILALVVAIMVISWGLGWIFAGPKGKLEARQQILSGASRIQAYDHFFDACASIQALEAKLAAEQQHLAVVSADDRDRVQANVSGLRGALAEAIADYNADAAKNYTIGQFRDLRLPYLIATPLKGETTSCAVS